MNWRQLLLTLVILALVAVLAGLMWRLAKRWLAGRGVGAGVLDLVRRYDRIGARTLRDRRPSEGLARYGAAVSDGSGDGRLAEAGELISDTLYNPTSRTGPEAEAVLDDLESSPPPRRPSRRHRLPRPRTIEGSAGKEKWNE